MGKTGRKKDKEPNQEVQVKLNTYLVTRPYCKPSHVVVLAEGKSEAEKVVKKLYGYCENTKAILKTEPGVILSTLR